MKWKKTIRWLTATLVLFLIVILAAAVLLKSNRVRQYAARKIEQAVVQSIGGHTQIGSFDLSLSPLTVRLKNVVVHGSERENESPLLRVDELTVGIELHALLHKDFHLRELVVHHPVVSVRLDAHGVSNIPQARPSQGHTSVYDLAIGHFSLSQGEIDYNDKKTPMSADVDSLHADIRFDRVSSTYAGAVSYNHGQLAYGPYTPIPHSAIVEFSTNPSQFSLKSAVIKVASSILSLEGVVTNLSNPSVEGNYDLQLHTQDFASMLAGTKTAGNIHTFGTVHYQNNDHQSLVSSFAVNGALESDEVSAGSPQATITVRALAAHYSLQNGILRASAIKAETLGGQITADAEMRNLASTPVSRVQAEVHHILVDALQQSIRQAHATPVKISGSLDGTTEASWSGSLNNVQARADLNVRGGAKNVGNNSAMIPVDAAIHAIYDGRNQTVILRQSNLRAASLTLTADGEVSRRSSLRVHAQADDLHQLIPVAASFGPGMKAAPAISGSATLDATVQGSIQRPLVSGQFHAANLQVDGSEWKSAGSSFTISHSQIAVSNGSLINSNQGRASFAASIALENWSYSPGNPIQADLSVQKMPISELQQLGHVQYPVSGDLSAQVRLSGSQLNPSGSGTAKISSARAYGEAIQTLALKSQAANGSITANLSVAVGAGSATASMTYTPKTRGYSLKLDAPAIALEKIRRLQPRQVRGTISASVAGQGTLDNPQLSASIQAPKLELQHNSIGAIKADLAMQNRRVNLTLDSQVSQTTLHVRGQVDLTGDYETDASIDSSAISLGPLLSSFSSSVPLGFQGQTELHATLKGPLKDTSRLEAHVTIPTLSASYEQLQIAAAGPIHADFANSTLTLQPAEIHGTGTSLRVHGGVPFTGGSVPTLMAQGSIDMQIARIFAPSVRTSGSVFLDIHATGSPKSPSIRGQISLQNVAASTTAAPIGVDNLNGTLDVDNDRVQISGMTAHIGSGDVSLGGAITYRPQLQFALAMQGTSIRLRYPQGLRTVLDGNLALSGNMQASTLTGRVLVDSLSFTPDFDLSSFGNQFSSNLAPAQPGIADTVRLSVSVQSKDNLSANSSQVSVEGSLNLNVNGTAANPAITGRTELTSGELFYRGNRYQLQRGVITFADPNQTNPNLNISVTSTIEQYNVTINLRGSLDRLSTTYSSDPPLATADVIHLIAFGNTTAEASAQNAAQSTDAMVASSVIGTGVTSGVQKLVGFSSLQIDPLLGGSNQNPSARIALQQRVTKNFLFTFSTDVSQPGQEIVQGDYQINKRWSVSVTRDQLGGVTVGGRFHSKF